MGNFSKSKFIKNPAIEISRKDRNDLFLLIINNIKSTRQEKSKIIKLVLKLLFNDKDENYIQAK